MDLYMELMQNSTTSIASKSDPSLNYNRLDKTTTMDMRCFHKKNTCQAKLRGYSWTIKFNFAYSCRKNLHLQYAQSYIAI